jgi:hypothetical protein
MDIGVWMSRGVLEHKRSPEYGTQVWNLRQLPEGFPAAPGPHRLFVAVDGHWRGFFRLLPQVLRNDSDPHARFTLAFDPRTWTPILPERAAARQRHQSHSLQLPAIETLMAGTKAETDTTGRDLSSLLERAEERE